MKIWIDDLRTPPSDDYKWIRSVDDAMLYIVKWAKIDEGSLKHIELINIDHDAGDFSWNGGDYIELLKWLEQKQYTDMPPIHIHSMNPVGVANMRLIIQPNGWKEI